MLRGTTSFLGLALAILVVVLTCPTLAWSQTCPKVLSECDQASSFDEHLECYLAHGRHDLAWKFVSSIESAEAATPEKVRQLHARGVVLRLRPRDNASRLKFRIDGEPADEIDLARCEYALEVEGPDGSPLKLLLRVTVDDSLASPHVLELLVPERPADEMIAQVAPEDAVGGSIHIEATASSSTTGTWPAESAPLPLVPGEYSFEASRDGREAWSARLQVGVRKDGGRTLTLLAPPLDVLESPPPPPPEKSLWRWAPLIGTGVLTVASTIGFFVADHRATSEKEEFNRLCSASTTGSCDAYRDHMAESELARGHRDMLGWSAIVAGAGAVGAFGFLLATDF